MSTPSIRAALAPPEGEGPGEQEIDAFIYQWWEAFGKGYLPNSSDKALVAAALARWGCPTAPPAPEHAGGSINDEQREAVIAAVTEALGKAYDCQRVWEAWGVGTMGEDDFELVAEDSDRVAEIADAAIEAMRPAAPPAPEVGEVTEVREWLENHAAHLRKMQEIGALPETELQEMLDRAATLLSQLSAPAPAVVPVEKGPVAVSERLPDPRPESEGGDCDAEGRCWWFSPPAFGAHKIRLRSCWTLDSETMEGDTHWRPASAIPLPQAGEGES